MQTGLAVILAHAITRKPDMIARICRPQRARNGVVTSRFSHRDPEQK